MLALSGAQQFQQYRHDDSKKLARVAVEFERLFAEMMIREMRNTVGDGGLFERNQAEQMFTEMLDSEFAKKMVRNGGLGLAQNIIEQMSRIDSGIDAQAALGALKAQNNGARAAQFSAQGLRSFDNPRAQALPAIYSNEIMRDVNFDAFAPAVRQWEDIIGKAAHQYNLDPFLVAAVMDTESSGRPNVVSHAGASGLMQLMPGTARDLGVTDVFDPKQNVMGGARYLRRQLDRFGGDLKLALAAYNAGAGNVQRFGGVPPFRETQNYVERIMRMVTINNANTNNANRVENAQTQTGGQGG